MNLSVWMYTGVLNYVGQRVRRARLLLRPATPATTTPPTRESHRRRRENTTIPKSLQGSGWSRRSPSEDKVEHQPASSKGNGRFATASRRPTDRHRSISKTEPTALLAPRQETVYGRAKKPLPCPQPQPSLGCPKTNLILASPGKG